MASTQRFATFFLNNICFGVPIENVQEFLEHQVVTRVPLAPAMLPGIINLRGQILTTIDLRLRLGLASGERADDPMMMVVRTSEGAINFLVDRIGPALDVDPTLFEESPETIKPAIRLVTLKVGKLDDHLLLVLDTEKLIQMPAQGAEFAAVRSHEKKPA